MGGRLLVARELTHGGRTLPGGDMEDDFETISGNEAECPHAKQMNPNDKGSGQPHPVHLLRGRQVHIDRLLNVLCDVRECTWQIISSSYSLCCLLCRPKCSPDPAGGL
jgi:hypothetical protein